MSGATAAVDRARAAARILRDRGLAPVAVRASGPHGEIALISLPASEWSRLLAPDSAAVVAAVKAEGFRYVALDLDADAAGA